MSFGKNVPAVLVVDDESDMRMLVHEVIRRANDGLTIVGQAASGEEAIDAFLQLVPHLLDIG